ncbi:MAG: winged helix-turn-helix transcriptional regulator [Atopobiaceae bacterium]|nr:winged helix-turn-helix transcriptional regulator [Atopobiaceae bacterium]
MPQRSDPLFAWLPIETLVAEHQQEYYDALGQSERDADATQFVEFMLGIIAETLREQVLLSDSDNKSDNKPLGPSIDDAILRLLAENPAITQSDAAKQLGIARSTLARHLTDLQANGRLRRVGARKNGYWEVLRGGEE